MSRILLSRSISITHFFPRILCTASCKRPTSFVHQKTVQDSAPVKGNNVTFMVKQKLAHSYILSFSKQAMKNIWNSNMKIICIKAEKTLKIVPRVALHLLLLYKLIYFFSCEIWMPPTYLRTHQDTPIHKHFLEHPAFQPVHQMPWGSSVGETAAATVHWNEPAEPTDREQKHPISCRHAVHQGSAASLFSVLIFKADHKTLQKVSKGNEIHSFSRY